MNEVQRLQIEGFTRPKKGAYRVVWRMKLTTDFSLGNVEFITCVLNDTGQDVPVKRTHKVLFPMNIRASFVEFSELLSNSDDGLTPLQRSDLMSLNQKEEKDKTLETQVLALVRTRSQKREVMDTVAQVWARGAIILLTFCRVGIWK